MSQRRTTTLETSLDESELSKLMCQALDGNGDSYRQALQRIEKMVTSFVRNSINRSGSNTDLTQDIVQEILIGIHAKRHTYHRDSYFLPWMYAIARYKFIDHLRRARVESKVISKAFTQDSYEELLEQTPSNRLEPESEISDASLETQLEKLSDRQREILKLVKLDEMSVADAALKTGLSESNVKVIIHRSMESLKKMAALKKGEVE